MKNQSPLSDLQKRALVNKERAHEEQTRKDRLDDPIEKSVKLFFPLVPADTPLKDDQATMEHPFFSLSKTPDHEIRNYEHNGSKIRIEPGKAGMPTIWDKDILLFIMSQLVDAKNRGLSISRTVRFKAINLMNYCERNNGGEDYDRLVSAFNRLAGALIVTDIKTNKVRQRGGFHYIESWYIVEKNNKGKMNSLEVTLSEWMYNSIIGGEILTMPDSYLQLTGGIERRLYEIVRKHCGGQKLWGISLEMLHKKMGSTAELRRFRRQIRDVISKNDFPDYLLELDCSAAYLRVTKQG